MDEKKRLNRECVNCIVAGCVIAFVLAPFAGWYAITVGLVAAYQLSGLVCEIADERNDRKHLAWAGFACASIIFLAAILAVAAWYFI